jgi:predicted PhzF superfamily epimerase YddE/YHI9
MLRRQSACGCPGCARPHEATDAGNRHEFNYSETAFIFPPREPDHTAQVRIFTSRTEAPFAGHPDATIEDPATGSASGATIALLAQLQPEPDVDRSWRIEQGVDMGRPSLILGRTQKRGGVVTAVHIAGYAVDVMRGVMRIP